MPAEDQPAVLVCHQRDQRRDDDREVGGRYTRKLVAEALAAAGRHHDEAVTAGKRGLHGLALPGAELRVAEVSEQRIGVARSLVGSQRRLDVDPVEALERELRLALFPGGLRGGQRLRGVGCVRAGRAVQRAPQVAQLLELAVDRRRRIGLDAGGQRECAVAEGIHLAQPTRAGGPGGP